MSFDGEDFTRHRDGRAIVTLTSIMLKEEDLDEDADSHIDTPVFGIQLLFQ